MHRTLRMAVAGLALTIGLGLTSSASAQFLMVSGSTTAQGKKVALFDPYSGSLVNQDYIVIGGGGIPKHALQVGNEVWVSEQAAGIIHRYDLNGSFVGQITQAAPGQPLNNLRGMRVVGNQVYVTNAGTLGGAPGHAIVRYDLNGNWLGTNALSHTFAMSILPYGNELLISFDSGATDIQRYSLDLNPLGAFHVGPVTWTQGLALKSNGNVLVAGFSSPSGIYEYTSAGAQVSYIAQTGSRAVWELGNGNLMWTNSSGVHVWDVVSGTNTTILSGFNAQFIDSLVIPAPGAVALLGMAGLSIRRRRRD